MDAEQTDAIDIGVDEHISEISNRLLSLANPVAPIAEQENALKIEDYLKKESKEGDCHIFDYQEFDTLPPRKGSEKDAARLKHDFAELNLEVHHHKKLSYKETFSILNEASSKDYSNSKYFICCFLTHGSQNTLWAKDRSMNIDDILIKFSESSSLKGIRKIFIIQACRGKVPEEGAPKESTDSGFLTDTQNYLDLDFLIVNSTYLDTVSFKTSDEEAEKCHGSFFIDEFCRSLEQFSSKLDLLQILTIVNYRMANIFLSHHKEKPEIDKKKQMPCFISTLREKVEFNREIEKFVSSDTEYFTDRRKRHGSGHDSTDYFLSNSNFYNIKEADRVLYLHIVDKKVDREDCEVQKAVHSLWGTFANKDYSRKQFCDKFRKSRIVKFLNESSNRAKKLSEVDCLICYIAAYSRSDSVCDADGRKISKKEIVEKFIGQLNKSFVGKPKIFIFLLRKLGEKETLAGERFCEDVESPIESDINTKFSGLGFHISTDGGTDQNINPNARGFNTSIESTDGGCIVDNLIPVHADILEISITVTDWKHVIKPMDLFCRILEEKSTSTDLLSLLTEFNCELIKKHNFFQLPTKTEFPARAGSSFSLTSTLTKLLFLP